MNIAHRQRLCVRYLQTADVITELKLGNGTSILIFANIASALPTSVGGAVQQVGVLLQLAGCPLVVLLHACMPHVALHSSGPPRCVTAKKHGITVTLQASTENSSNLAVYVLAFFLTTMGIVYVQEAERKIPMNYASRYRTGSLGRQSYLPFKVRSTRQLLGTSCTLQFIRVQPHRAPLLVVT